MCALPLEPGLGDQTGHMKLGAASVSQDTVNWMVSASQAPGSRGLDELLFLTRQQSTPSPQHLLDQQACGKQEVVTHFVNRSLGTGSTGSPVPRANIGSRCPVSKRQTKQEISQEHAFLWLHLVGSLGLRGSCWGERENFVPKGINFSGTQMIDKVGILSLGWRGEPTKIKFPHVQKKFSVSKF